MLSISLLPLSQPCESYILDKRSLVLGIKGKRLSNARHGEQASGRNGHKRADSLHNGEVDTCDERMGPMVATPSLSIRPGERYTQLTGVWDGAIELE